MVCVMVIKGGRPVLEFGKKGNDLKGVLIEVTKMVLTRADDGDQQLFYARSDNVKALHSVLKAIQFREKATVCATLNGLKVSVEDTACVQISAFLQTQLFETYQLAEDNVNFCINLRVLCECLNIFGAHSSVSTATTVKMSYATHEAPLKLELEESGITTDCSIRTLELDQMTDFEFSLAAVAAKIIMKADPIRETFADLDGECMEIIIDPEKGIKFITTGVSSTSEAAIQKDSDLIEAFDCENRISNKYRVELLKSTIKPLNLATKVSFRIDERGIMSMQYMVEQEGQVIFVEFFCAPQEEEEVNTQSTF